MKKFKVSNTWTRIVESELYAIKMLYRLMFTFSMNYYGLKIILVSIVFINSEPLFENISNTIIKCSVEFEETLFSNSTLE